MREENITYSNWENVSQIFSSNPTNDSETGGWQGSNLKRLVHVREVRMLKIHHQAPSSCKFLYSKLRPADSISWFNPSPIFGSNIIINQRKLKMLHLSISSRHALCIILFLDPVWPVISVVFTLPWPCSFGQFSCVLLSTYYMPTLGLDTEIQQFLQEVNNPLLLER